MTPLTTTTIRANGSTLTLNSSGNLSFCLKGLRLWQTDALCILHFYDRQHPRAQQVVVPWDNSQAFGTKGTLSLSARSTLDFQQENDRTVLVAMAFDTLHMRIVMRIELDAAGDGFDVAIAKSGVTEEMPCLYRFLGLEILPEFGAARTGEQGYLTLSNWYGCQTFFDKAYPREVWQTVYSSNDQWENVCNAPVFGITRAQGTLCGLVTEGDEDAQLVCRRHWEAARANSVHPYLVWRWAQKDDVISGQRRVRYRFSHPDCPQGEGYAFVGVQYRTFLRAERGVQTWAQKGLTRPEALEYAERFFLKIFMAYKDPHPDGKGEYHCTCTCDEAREILRECLARGMKKLTAVFVGWGQDGHDGKCPTYLPVDERVGGNAKMTELVAWCRGNDILAGMHTCHGASYPCSDEFNVDDLIRHRSGEYWESVIWSGGQGHRVCPSISLEKFVKPILPKLADLGIHGHHHYDAVGGFECCYAPQHPVTLRSEYMSLIREEFKVALDVMGSVSTEMPFGQYFGVVDGFFHSFSNPGTYLRNCAIARHFLDGIVPMLGMALHGSHNCCESVDAAKDTNIRKRMLELLDFGLSPQSEVCMRPSSAFGIPAYTAAAENLAEAYRFAFGPDGYVKRLVMHDIEARWELAPGVSRTRYSGGTVVEVNQSGSDFDDLPASCFRFYMDKKGNA